MLIFCFFQPRTYVPIIRQKIENLVFLFEIQSNFPSITLHTILLWNIKIPIIVKLCNFNMAAMMMIWIKHDCQYKAGWETTARQRRVEILGGE